MDIDRLRKQENALVKCEIFDYLCELSMREKCLLFHQYENISNYINSCMKYLNEWINKAELNTSPVEMENGFDFV